MTYPESPSGVGAELGSVPRLRFPAGCMVLCKVQLADRRESPWSPLGSSLYPENTVSDEQPPPPPSD